MFSYFSIMEDWERTWYVELYFCFIVDCTAQQTQFDKVSQSKNLIFSLSNWRIKLFKIRDKTVILNHNSACMEFADFFCSLSNLQYLSYNASYIIHQYIISMYCPVMFLQRISGQVTAISKEWAGSATSWTQQTLLATSQRQPDTFFCREQFLVAKATLD